MKKQKLKIKKLNPDAILPRFACQYDAGMDLFSVERYEIKSGETAMIKTGLAMEIPVGCVGLFWDKSGIATKMGLKTMAGVIDAGYRGELIVVLINLSKETRVIEKGVKVSQMLIQEVKQPEIEVCEELSGSERGAGGFGSTGHR